MSILPITTTHSSSKLDSFLTGERAVAGYILLPDGGHQANGSDTLERLVVYRLKRSGSTTAYSKMSSMITLSPMCLAVGYRDLFEQSAPLNGECVHEADIETRGVARPERHSTEGVLLAIRRALVTVTHAR